MKGVRAAIQKTGRIVRVVRGPIQEKREGSVGGKLGGEGGECADACVRRNGKGIGQRKKQRGGKRDANGQVNQ